ncbi:MAG: hypothetical protein NC244_05435 [Alistipes senegalensis]|nr:hypothetical protein [Alistipes senegalensis]
MMKFNKFAAAAMSFALAATTVGCTPTIGKGTEMAMTADGTDISSGLFIFYTIRAYQDAADIIEGKNGTAPTVKEVKNSHIDDIEASDWIQDKATEYCMNIAAIENEFNKTGGQLTSEEIAEIEELADNRLDPEGTDIYSKNGVGKESIKKIISTTGSGSNYYGEYEYMQKHIFDYYYGFDGEKGCTEDELKDYFEENFARVKYISIDMTDEEGEPLSDDDKKALRRKAEEYVREINGEKSDMDKMFKMNECKEDYEEYISTQTTAVEDEEATTTTTTTTTTTDTDETQTTTTTDPYENERLVQKYTTTTADESETDSTATTTAEESDYEKADREYKQFVFEKLEMNKAVLYEYDENTLYVLIRGDLRERMTEDDFWSDEYIYSLQLLRYNDDFTDYMEKLADNIVPEKNNSSFKRYAPFKLDLSSLEPQT